MKKYHSTFFDTRMRHAFKRGNVQITEGNELEHRCEKRNIFHRPAMKNLWTQDAVERAARLDPTAQICFRDNDVAIKVR